MILRALFAEEKCGGEVDGRSPVREGWAADEAGEDRVEEARRPRVEEPGDPAVGRGVRGERREVAVGGKQAQDDEALGWCVGEGGKGGEEGRAGGFGVAGAGVEEIGCERDGFWERGEERRGIRGGVEKRGLGGSGGGVGEGGRLRV